MALRRSFIFTFVYQRKGITVMVVPWVLYLPSYRKPFLIPQHVHIRREQTVVPQIENEHSRCPWRHTRGSRKTKLLSCSHYISLILCLEVSNTYIAYRGIFNLYDMASRSDTVSSGPGFSLHLQVHATNCVTSLLAVTFVMWLSYPHQRNIIPLSFNLISKPFILCIRFVKGAQCQYFVYIES